jgi:hypothetical protein
MKQFHGFPPAPKFFSPLRLTTLRIVILSEAPKARSRRICFFPAQPQMAALSSIPLAAKAALIAILYGTAEAVPLQIKTTPGCPSFRAFYGRIGFLPLN